MRRANEIVQEISLSSELLETSRLHSSAATIRANADTVSRWIESLTSDYGEPQANLNGPIVWQDIPKDRVADVLGSFVGHPLNYDFQSEQLSRYLRDTAEPVISVWDVAIPPGSADPTTFGGLSLSPRRRRVVSKLDSRSLLVSGSSARVG
jgi:hypothetical protein